MKNKNWIGLSVFLLILILFGIGYQITDKTHFCQSRGIVMECERFSGSGLRCYPNLLNNTGYRDCSEGWINLKKYSDPYGVDDRPIGYNILNGFVAMWNSQDVYYFDRDSGSQFTNHFQNYWTQNTFCLGYYSGEEWIKIKCSDELGNFNQDFQTDNQTYANSIFWKDFTYSGYDLRFGIKYHLGLNDENLSVQIYLENMDEDDIPYDLGFAWKIHDIRISGNEKDEIYINSTNYNLNKSMDLSFKNISRTFEYLGTNQTVTEFLPFFILKSIKENGFIRLDWDKNLNYKVKLYSDGIQEDAYVMLLINVGDFVSGQFKSTIIYWEDPSTKYEYYSASYVGDVGLWGAEVSVGQTFTVGTVGTNENHFITSVKLDLFRTGSPETLNVTIKAVDGSGLPTGSVLSTGTTNGSTLPTSAPGEWREINMSSYLLQASTKYAIILNESSTVVDNKIHWLLNNDNYAGGNYVQTEDGGSSWSSESYDLLFEVWGLADTTSPVSSFGTNPVNNYNSINSSVTFDFKSSDNVDIDFIQLFGNWTGTWHANYTNSSYTNNTWLNISVDGISDGYYKWGIYSNDSAGNENWTGTNRTFTVDTIGPSIDFVFPTETNASIYFRNYIQVNVTASDSLGVKNISVYLFNSSSMQINSSNSSSSPLFANFTGLSDGVYYFNATAYDTLNQSKSTLTRQIEIESVAPIINITYPLNTSYSSFVTNLNYTYIESNPHVCWYSTDSGANNYTISCGSNVTGLSSNLGLNTWMVAIRDIAGNEDASYITFTITALYTKPSEFGTTDATTCWIGGILGIMNCTGAGWVGSYFQIDDYLLLKPHAIRTCNAALEGAIYYNTTNKKHYGCNSTDWLALY